MVPLEHLVQQPPLQVFLGDGEDHHHEDVQRPGGLDHLERSIKDLFGKTLEVERDPSFDRESVMGHRGLKKFRGVTRHKRTQRYEAHIWESKKQIYLGGFESEMLAARSHDIMALKCKGSMCDSLNFGKKEYEEVMAILPGCDKEDIISCLKIIPRHIARDLLIIIITPPPPPSHITIDYLWPRATPSRSRRDME